MRKCCDTHAPGQIAILIYCLLPSPPRPHHHPQYILSIPSLLLPSPYNHPPLASPCPQTPPIPALTAHAPIKAPQARQSNRRAQAGKPAIGDRTMLHERIAVRGQRHVRSWLRISGSFVGAEGGREILGEGYGRSTMSGGQVCWLGGLDWLGGGREG